MKRIVPFLLTIALMVSGCVVRNDNVDVPYKPMTKDDYNKAVRDSRINIKYTDYQMESFKKTNSVKEVVCIDDMIVVYDDVDLDYLSPMYNIMYGRDINTDIVLYIQEGQDEEEICDLISESTALGHEDFDRVIPVTDYVRKKAIESPLKFITVENLVDIISKPS